MEQHALEAVRLQRGRQANRLDGRTADVEPRDHARDGSVLWSREHRDGNWPLSYRAVRRELDFR
jgi:hypothetical protein